VLGRIADLAELTKDDTVLEIGPGLGTLTSELLRRAGGVVAVELDGDLAAKLPGQFPGKNLKVVNTDILSYDPAELPANYVVVANVPYYITSKIIQRFTTTENRPRKVVILVQKEVAERVAAKPGDMSILAVSAQVYAEASLGDVVPAQLFTPPPKVDSQVVVLTMRRKPLVAEALQPLFFRVVKAGFSAKRKKLRRSLAGGLGMNKEDVERLLTEAAIDGDLRAEMLSVEDWQRLAQVYSSKN